MDKVPNLDSTGKGLRDALAGEDERLAERQVKLDSSRPSESFITPDAALGKQFSHGEVAKHANFSEKIYLFPPAFVALREELQNNWRDFFETTSPLTGTSPAHCMVFDAPQFIGFCNGMTGLAVQHDTGDVNGICKKFLNAFRKLRGVGEIQ